MNLRNMNPFVTYSTEFSAKAPNLDRISPPFRTNPSRLQNQMPPRSYIRSKNSSPNYQFRYFQESHRVRERSDTAPTYAQGKISFPDQSRNSKVNQFSSPLLEDLQQPNKKNQQNLQKLQLPQKPNSHALSLHTDRNSSSHWGKPRNKAVVSNERVTQKQNDQRNSKGFSKIQHLARDKSRSPRLNGLFKSQHNLTYLSEETNLNCRSKGRLSPSGQSIYGKMARSVYITQGDEQDTNINRLKGIKESKSNCFLSQYVSSQKKDYLQKLKNKVSSYIAFLNDMQNSANVTVSTSTSIEAKSPYCSSELQTSSSSQKRDSSLIQTKTSKLLDGSQLTHRPVLSQFSILKKIGQGRFGELFVAIHKRTGFVAALKKISKQAIKRDGLVERVVLEIKIQLYLQHPNIVKLYGFFQDKDSIYLMMEYLEEGSLYDLMMKNKYHKKSVSLLSEQRVSNILRDVLKGLSELHQNRVIHRDIKPENIVLTNGVCKLCDLGWAVVNQENGRRSTTCGTFDYTPPEILKNQEYVQSVDLWELGVLSYELMTGKLPFYHPSRKETYMRITNFCGDISFPKQLPTINRNFIRGLLQRNSKNRMPASSILLHPFITKYEN